MAVGLNSLTDPDYANLDCGNGKLQKRKVKK